MRSCARAGVILVAVASGGPYESVRCAARQPASSTCAASSTAWTLPAGVQKTIETRDPATFSKAYRDALSGC